MKKLTNKMIKFSALLITAITLGYTAYSQTISIAAELRPRIETTYGFRVPPDTINKPQYLASQRTRLEFSYMSDKIAATINFQDVRVWGDEVMVADLASIGLYEAWAQYNFSKKARIRLGRQRMTYDNQRLIGNSNWLQQGRSADAALLQLRPCQNWKIDISGSYNQDKITLFNTFYSLANPKTLNFLWVNHSMSDSVGKHSVSLLGMADGYQTPDSTGVEMRYTYGLYANWERSIFGITAELFRQDGKTRTVNQSGNIVPDSFQTVKAFMFSVNPYVNVTPRFQIGAGLDFLSGTDNLDTTLVNETNMFNPQYGNIHPFLGNIDVFFSMPTDTRNGGIVNPYLTLRYKIKKWNLMARYDLFRLQNNVEDVENPGQPLDKALGNEIDIWATAELSKEVSINTGFSLLLPERSLEFVKTAGFSQIGGPPVNGHWVYMMLTFTPVFFSK